MNSFAQKMEIITRTEEKIKITILDSEKTKEVIKSMFGALIWQSPHSR